MNSKFTPKIVMLLLAFCFSAKAQVTTVKASIMHSNSSAGITDLTNAVDVGDNYLSTYARITSVNNVLNASLNNRYVEIAFAQDVPAGTPVYLKMTSDPENNVLGVLAGGAIGNLLTGVLNTVLIGNQTITVEGYTAAGTTSLYSTSSFNNENFRVVFNAAGQHFLKITHTAAYRRIKIVNTAIAGTLDNNKNLDVYGAYFQTGTATCASAAYTSYNAGGLLSVVDINISNPAYAIDANATTHSSLTLGVLGVGEWISQTVYFEGASTSTDTYNLKVSIPPALLAAGLINGITVQAYSGNSTVAAYSGTLSSLLGLPVNAQVLGLLQNNQPAILSVTPGAPVDRIVLRYEALLAVNIAYNIYLYEITKGFSVNVTGSGTYHVNNAVNLVANILPQQCSATYTYSWVATGSSTVLGTNQTYSPPTTTPGTYNYTVTVTDSFGVVKTGTAQVIVQAPPVAGSLNNISLLCTDTPATNLTLTGNTGNVVRWEKADNAAFNNKVDIAITNTFLTPAQIGAITQPTYFRAVVTQNNYPEVVTTTGGLVTPKTSTWNGSTWSNGTPDIGTIIYFTGNFTATANLDGCRIIVQNSAVVNIPATFTVHLNKSINVQSGSFTLQDNAHLIQDTSTEANLGNITVVKNSSSLFKLDYTLWSAPVAGQNLKAFSPATLNNRFYYYEYLPANSAEVYVPIDPVNNSFDTARGYLIRMPNVNEVAGYDGGTTAITFVGQFTGVPNNGTITRTLSTVSNRFTAVGNPYPSPISVLDFYAANASVLKTGSALYFWRKKNNTNASSYATLTTDLYTYNHATGGNAGEGQYGGIQWDQYFNGSSPSTWVINPGQGFIVKTKDELAPGSNPQLTFNTAMRRGNAHNTQFFRTNNTPDNSEEGLKSRIWIDMTGATEAFSQAALVYSSTATMALDYGRDAQSFSSGSSIELWSTAENIRLVVQARPAFTTADVVPMGYRADAPGQYTFTIHDSDGVFEQGQDIYIKDNMLGTTTKISNAPYIFTTEAGTFNGRFEIVYMQQGQLGTGEAELTNGSVIVYQQNNAINISCSLATITDVAVYDVRGRKLYTANNINANETSITGLAVQQQVLIIEVTTEKGKVSKKIVF